VQRVSWQGTGGLR